MSNDEQKIRDLIATWMRASERGDLQQVVRLMAEDVVFLTPGNAPMRGREAFSAASRAMAPKFRIEGTSEVQEIRVTGDWAYCWTKLSVTMTPRDGGEPKLRSGEALTILRRNTDGAWVVYRDANLLA
jgi:uncharacterized protein (TIGR02246 family)